MAARTLIAFDVDGFTEEVDQVADTFTVAGLTLTGNLAMGANAITGLADGTAADDAATKGQLDTVSAGLNPKGEVLLATDAALPAYTASGSGVGKTITMNSVGVLTIDGVATVLNDLILVKSEAAAHVDHGIYKVTTEGTAGVAAVLTRDTSFDGSPSNEVGSADFVFVQSGSANGSSGWYVKTADPITVDTTAIEFAQFSGAGAIPVATSAPGGGVQGKVTFDSDFGLQVNSGVAKINLAANPGLQFTAGAMEVLEDPNGGIEVVAAGTKIKLDGTTLSLGALGASVLGVPAAGTWEIGGSATGASVTAANLSSLTDGSNADALHTHASAAAQINADTGGVSKGDPLYCSGLDVVAPASAAVGAQAKGFMGVASSTVTAGNPVGIANDGDVITGVLTAATPNDLVYMAVGGGLTTTAPGSGNFRVIVGKAKNATDLVVYAQYLGKAA